jgi:hypothetical protein
MEYLRYLLAYIVTGVHVAGPAALGVFEAPEEVDFELTSARAARTGVTGEIAQSNNDCHVLALSVQRGGVPFNSHLVYEFAPIAQTVPLLFQV